MKSCSFSIPDGRHFTESPLQLFCSAFGLSFEDQSHKFDLLDEQGQKIVMKLHDTLGENASFSISPTVVDVLSHISEEQRRIILVFLRKITGSDSVYMFVQEST